MSYTEDEFLSLSGIQHFAFCRRQWALIHIEQQWCDNVRTLEGHFLHEKAHETNIEKRGDIFISRGMPIFSEKLGVNGYCDVVEFHPTEQGVEIFNRKGFYSPIPIEYKKGRPKDYDADELQICTQAMCLEEMLNCTIDKGYLYYGETKHRVEVIFNEDLKTRVVKTLEEMHKLYDRKWTPKVKTSKSCNACSLKDICLPKLNRAKLVCDYIKSNIGCEKDEEIT